MSVDALQFQILRVLPTRGTKAWIQRGFVLVLGVLVLVGWMGTARAAENVEDQYLAIVSLIQEADTLASDAKQETALVKYRQALAQLQGLQKANRDWNTKTVNFRLKYLAQKIANMSPKEAPASSPAPSVGTTAGSFKLLAPGAEPRRTLRLHPKAGDKQTVTMTLKMVSEPKIGDMPAQPVKMPAIKMVMELTVTAVSSEGEITYTLSVSDATVMEDADTLPAVAEALKGSLASAKGMSGSGTMSSRGVGKPVELKASAGSDAQARQALEQIQGLMQGLSPKLPEEAVGAGAKLEVKTPIVSQGMTLQQTTVYEIASLEDEQMSLKADLVQTASNQKVSNPAMPGLKMDLTRMNGKGTGTSTYDLSRVMPSQGTSEFHADFDMAMEMGGQKQPMTMKLDMKVQIESK